MSETRVAKRTREGEQNGSNAGSRLAELLSRIEGGLPIVGRLAGAKATRTSTYAPGLVAKRLLSSRDVRRTEFAALSYIEQPLELPFGLKLRRGEFLDDDIDFLLRYLRPRDLQVRISSLCVCFSRYVVHECSCQTQHYSNSSS